MFISFLLSTKRIMKERKRERKRERMRREKK